MQHFKAFPTLNWKEPKVFWRALQKPKDVHKTSLSHSVPIALSTRLWTQPLVQPAPRWEQWLIKKHHFFKKMNFFLLFFVTSIGASRETTEKHIPYHFPAEKTLGRKSSVLFLWLGAGRGCSQTRALSSSRRRAVLTHCWLFAGEGLRGCYGQMACFHLMSTPLSLSFLKEHGKKNEEKVEKKGK